VAGREREQVVELIFYVLISLVLLLLSLKLFFQDSKPKPENSRVLTIAALLPVHHHEFEEVERRLCG